MSLATSGAGGGPGLIVLTYGPYGPPFVGVVRYWLNSAPATKYLWMTIVPDEDSELDNPAWTTGILTGTNSAQYSVDMVKIPRSQYDSYTSFAAFMADVVAMP